MNTYLVLLRGINVGGKNKMPMTELRLRLAEIGFENVRTYIASGNVLVDSHQTAAEVTTKIEALLPKAFKLDQTLINVVVLDKDQLHEIIRQKPTGFGDRPDMYHSDVIFLMKGLPVDSIIGLFKPRAGVDQIWPGPSVVYSQRLSAERSKSRLNVIIGLPEYKLITIRNWNTTTKLLAMMSKA